ncbi:MAG: M23 family metallopeptidase [Anaerolineae bacterium]|nr:M23 family metallopeptidase [Anaerolineae bacterium]
MRLRRWAIACVFLLLIPISKAQYQGDDIILFVWNDVVMAQSVAQADLVTTEYSSDSIARWLQPSDQNSFNYQNSPLEDVPLNDYGYYQGFWSVDRTQFVFLAIEPEGQGYEIILFEDGQQTLLFADELSRERGYLVPIGWSDDGELILLERYMLHNLDEAYIWHYQLGASDATLQQSIVVPALRGNAAVLSDEWVFIGFDTLGVVGYLLNVDTNQTFWFQTALALQDPPASVFETYPIEVIGVTDAETVTSWADSDPNQTSVPGLTDSFLYWPLPDHARNITCYPDSEWTNLNYALECPGLAQPRAYEGHEGTDVGGKPAGLSPGTPVYAAAPGLVIKVNSACDSDDTSCGDAYGNYVLLEHARVVDHNVEVWYTGYAHLQTLLVNRYDFVSQIGLPIALSGDTGLGGAHLHFEVRSPSQSIGTDWLDPWDTRLFDLWVGDNLRPISAVEAFPPSTQMVCETREGNNIRSGPGTNYEVVTKSSSDIHYEVFQIQTILAGETPGDWYHIRWSESASTGWIWSDLMTTCTEM